MATLTAAALKLTKADRQRLLVMLAASLGADDELNHPAGRCVLWAMLGPAAECFGWGVSMRLNLADWGR